MSDDPEASIEMPAEPQIGLPPEAAEAFPELDEAFANATQGVFSNTLLKMWDVQLNDELQGYAGESTMDTHDQFMRSWPWLGYGNINHARRLLADYTREQLDLFDEAITYALRDSQETRDEVFENVEHDWTANKDIYIEICARWTAWCNLLGPRWQHARDRDKPVIHVASVVAVSRTIGSQGLVQQMKELAAFEFTDDDQEAMFERIEELIKAELGLVADV